MSFNRKLKFATLVGILQVVFIILMGVFGEYEGKNGLKDRISVYPNFQDVNVMIFIGFGFLLTYLKNHGFNSVGINMMIAVICVQWSAIVIGFIHNDILGGETFKYGVTGMTESNFAAATILISFCAVLGKTGPVQLVVMALFEIVFAQVNKYIGVNHFHATDIGESMYLHMFGAYFGMAVARVLYNPEVEKSEKEGSVYHSDLFAMVGTIFLWVYWPSFNGGFAGDQLENAVVNTFLSLCASTVMTFIFSALLDKNGKFEMVHIQNSTLAGGVAVGACANMPMKPFVALIIGSFAGMTSVVGYKYITPFMASKWKLHDTCGVHNLHGMPGWIAAIAAAILTATATVSSWGDKNINDIFSEVQVDNNSTITGRSLGSQAGYQMAAAFITTIIAILTGILTGFILKLPIWDAPETEYLFDDGETWNVPEGAPTPLEKKDVPAVEDTPLLG